MSHRKILIGASIAGHVALAAGVFVFGVWDLDQLEYEPKSRTALAVMTPPSMESGSPTLPKRDVQPKTRKVPVKEPRQPRPREKEPEIVLERPGPSEPGTGPGSGLGTGPTGSDGPEIGAACQEASAACAPLPVPPPPEPSASRPPPPDKKVHTITRQKLKDLRTSGETAIHPPHAVLQQMYRNGDLRTIASIQVCLATDGTVASVTLARSTKYAGYDEAILGAARRWRYQPYTVNGAPVPACGMVTFVYQMK